MGSGDYMRKVELDGLLWTIIYHSMIVVLYFIGIVMKVIFFIDSWDYFFIGGFIFICILGLFVLSRDISIYRRVKRD